MEHKKNISSATVNTNSTETSAHDTINDSGSEFYAVGNPITVARSQGFSGVYATPIKNFSTAEILNTFNQADKILLFETESDAENFAGKNRNYSDSTQASRTAHVIFKVKLSDMKQVADIQNTFHELNKFNTNKATYSQTDVLENKVGGLDNVLLKCIPVVEKENIVVLSANLMNQHKYTFEQLNPKASRCLVM